MSFVVIQAV